jgi:hypothetical protein
MRGAPEGPPEARGPEQPPNSPRPEDGLADGYTGCGYSGRVGRHSVERRRMQRRQQTSTFKLSCVVEVEPNLSCNVSRLVRLLC